MLPAFTAFMISSSLVRSVAPWKSTTSSPLERFVTSLANQSKATAALSGTALTCANTSFFGAACAKAGARPRARMPARPPAPLRIARRGAVEVTRRALTDDSRIYTALTPIYDAAPGVATCARARNPERCGTRKPGREAMPTLAAQNCILEYELIDLTAPWLPARETVVFNHGV